MKVLYLVPQAHRPDRIGAYSFLDEEIQALAAAGIEAYVLATAAPADALCGKVHLKSVDARAAFSRQLGAAGFLVRCADGIPSRNMLQPIASYRLAKLEHLAAEIVKEEGIDLIHSHFGWPQGLGGMMARAATGRPLVASLRGTDILVDPAISYGRRMDPAFDRAVRRLLRTADRTVYFSRYMRDHAVSLGARPDATRVIRKGVDLRQFAPAGDRTALRRELGLGSRPLILSVGGLIERKGIHHILDALALLRDELDFTFVVCGDGSERANLEAQAARLGLGDRTVFTGRVDRATIPKYFAACDVFVLGSILEAAGNVLFEAMASGRPIVCTDAGGPREYVSDGETGFVVKVGDTRGMARRIGLVLRDPGLQEALGQEARRRTLGEFDYDRMISDLIEVYRDMLKPTSSRLVAVS